MFIPKEKSPIHGRRIAILKPLEVKEGTYTQGHVFTIVRVIDETTLLIRDTESDFYDDGYKVHKVTCFHLLQDYLIIPDSI